ncbi:MAG: hypothetical protein EOO74_01685 [Myxococcales bacterium]|nr:MAG: hypothetical protein EOO74_01685 [Myxococcales bacterium]
MARRVSLPAADDLFRPTATKEADVPADADAGADAPAKRRSSGRIRHDEKMTVYVTADELIEIEHARLSLRRDHGLAIDRGRLVREAIAIALAEMEHEGADSSIVQRLSAS